MTLPPHDFLHDYNPLKKNVIPAKAGIQLRAVARGKGDQILAQTRKRGVLTHAAADAAWLDPRLRGDDTVFSRP
jgi:hypothetical protein